MKKHKKLFMVILIFTLLHGCSKNNDDKKEKQFGDEIPYTDMSEYKGVGGYVLENNVHDYTNVFDKVYDWGNGFKWPFPKPKGKEVGMTQGAYTLEYMSNEEIKEYFKWLEKYGFKTTITEEKEEQYGQIGLIHNDEALVTFNRFPVVKDIQTQDGEYTGESEMEDRITIWVFTGFVKNPLIKADKVREMIDESKLLKKDERFSEYFIIPIENETIRKAGYYECLIFSEKYGGAVPGEARPYYMVSDGENICILEEYGYSPYFPSSANYMEKGGKKIIVMTSGYYYYSPQYSSGYRNNTCMFTYELKDNKFIQIEKKRIRRENGDALYIGKLVDGEIKLYHLEYCYDDYGDDDWLLENKWRYVIDREYDKEEVETIIEE